MRTKQVSFAVSDTDASLIDEIVTRALTLARKQGVKLDRVSLSMDITACHANGCRLRLNELLCANPFDFSHDVFGIHKHMDRETGQLTDCFSPRYGL
jgi:hypothetical protein